MLIVVGHHDSVVSSALMLKHLEEAGGCRYSLADSLEEPIPASRIRGIQKRTRLVASPNERNAVRFEREGVQLVKWHCPNDLELAQRYRDNAVVGQDRDGVVARKIEVRNITLVEIGSGLELLEPRLAECLPSGEWLLSSERCNGMIAITAYHSLSERHPMR